MKTLIKKRSAFKSKPTTFNKHLNIFKSRRILSELQIAELECRLSKTENLKCESDALQDETEALCDKSSASGEDDESVSKRKRIENEYFKLVACEPSLFE